MKQVNGEKHRRRTEITIETHSVTVIRTNRKIVTANCEHCLQSVNAFTPEQLAGFIQLSTLEIYQRVAAKQFHLTNEGRGLAMICGNSLKDNERYLETKQMDLGNR